MTGSPRTLVLFRHAKAEPEGDLGDSQRPLSAAGRRQAGEMSGQLTAEVGDFDAVLVSSALRTTETAKILAQGLPDLPAADVRTELYGAGARQVVEILAELPADAHRVLVVGHEPTMSSLATVLAGTKDPLTPRVSFGIGTANAIVLDVPVPWAELGRATARLRAVLEPLS